MSIFIEQTWSVFNEPQQSALFKSLFRGREDVYPRRFESRKTDKSGDAPACANEWVRGICEKARIKCAACPHRRWEDEFFRRLLRAPRQQREQLILMHAGALVERAQPELSTPALHLVELFVQDFYHPVFASGAFLIRARAMCLLHRWSDAWWSFENSLAAPRSTPFAFRFRRNQDVHDMRQAHNIDELDGLASALHDWSCDVCAITVEGGTATLLLYEPGHPVSKAPPSKQLVIGNVDRAEVHDEQKIGFYDINRIVGISDPSTIVIEFNIATTCRFFVDKIDVRLTRVIHQAG